MAKVNALVNSFTAGEITPRLDARVDTSKFRTGLRICHNFQVMTHGGVRKRGGSKFVAPCKVGSTATRLIEFQYNTAQTYMLEVGYASGGYIRFFTNGGILTSSTKTITGATKANPCVITAVAHGFSNGDWVLITGVVGMTRLNNRHFQVANASTDTFELSGVNSSAYATYVSGGTASKIYEVATSYLEAEIARISFAQSADTLYIAHELHPLAKLERFAATTWTLSAVEIKNGPFRRINADEDNKIAVALTSIVVNISAATKASPCVITTAAHGLLDGATIDIASVSGMTELNGNTYSVRVLSSTTLALYDGLGAPVNSTAYTTYTSGGTVTQADTRWGTYSPGSQITLTAAKSTFDSGMVGALFRLWEPGKGGGVATLIYRASINNLADNAQYTNDGKVYGVANPSVAYWHFDWTQPNHESGVVRITDGTGTAFHDSVYLHDSTCVLLITGYSSATSITAKIIKNHLPKTVIASKTSFWEEGAWSTYRGHPSLLTFHEQRLWPIGNTAEPQTIWASRAGIFEDFQDGADDDRALIYKIASDKVEKPAWILAGKIMSMGTASGEYSIGSNNQNDAMTPSNVRIVRQTTWGSAPSRALRIGSASMFVQRDGDPTNGGRKIREFGYDFQSDAFVASDMSIISEHLGQSRILDLVHQQAPDSIVWGRRENGTLIGLTYEKEQEVLAWHRHTLAGAGASVGALGVIPGDDGDELWMIVSRTINSATVKYIEILTSQDIGTTDKADFRFLDCHLTYDGAPTETVSGLNHLEGETVSVLADGAVHPDVTVSGGIITLGREASVIHIGYGYTAVLETLDLEAGAQGGTAHGRPKRISELGIRVYRSLGGKAGPPDGPLDRLLYRTSGDPMNASPPLYSGFKRLDFDKGWGDEAVLRIEADQPLPCTVLSVTVELNVTG